MGFNMEYLKRFILVLLPILLLTLFLSGCSEGAATKNDKTASASIEDEEQPLEKGETSTEIEDIEEDAETPAVEISGDMPIIDGRIAPDEYSDSLKDDSTGIEFFWSHDNVQLFAGLKTDSMGWVSIGFDPESAMKGANIIFMALDSGKVLVRDDFGTSAFGHDDDIKLGGDNDITAYAADKEGELNIYEFIVPLNSGDEFDKVLIPGNTYGVILAENNNRIDFDSKHSTRGSAEIKLD
jgi:hypothetical protein